jgi:hypothetical protein
MVVSFASCSVLNGTVRGLLFLTKRVVHLAAFETRMQILAGVCGGWEILSAVRAKKITMSCVVVAATHHCCCGCDDDVMTNNDNARDIYREPFITLSNMYCK